MHFRIKINMNERVCVSPPPYYVDWVEISYQNFTLNWYGFPFFIQFMNGIQGTKISGQQWNWLLNTMVTTIKYKISTIDHEIYIKLFSDRTVYYLTFFTGDVLNTTNNER